MDRKTYAILICLWATLFLWVEENHYNIHLKFSPDLKNANSTQRIIYYNHNDFTLDVLHFRIRYTPDKPEYQIIRI
jgi:hypothetical protein